MSAFSYCVNTFYGSEPVQLCGTVEATDKINAVQVLKNNGFIDPKGYEFLELEVID